MLNYIKQELYRITHKKSMYIYYGSLILAFGILMLVGSNMDASSFLELLGTYMMVIVAVFVGGQVFASVYGDDVSSKSLGLAVSSGVSRTQIVLGKLIVAVLLLISIFTILGLVSVGIYLLYGGNFNPQDQIMIQYILFKTFVTILMLLAFMSLSSIVLYLTQNATVSNVLLILFIMQFVLMLLSLISMGIPYLNDLIPYTVSNTMSTLDSTYLKTQEIAFKELAILISYSIIGVGISAVILNKQEINN